MISDLKEFWTLAHKHFDTRWVSCSEPKHILSRLGVDLEGVESVLEIGPGWLHLANYLSATGRRVVIHDIVALDDPRYVAELPLKAPVDIAIAHLVLQHVRHGRALVEKVLASLVPGGTFYFDAIAADYNGPGIAAELANGTSFPFEPWDLVDERYEVIGSPGYFFCKARRK